MGSRLTQIKTPDKQVCGIQGFRFILAYQG